MDRQSIVQEAVKKAQQDVAAEDSAKTETEGKVAPQPAVDLAALRQQVGAQFSIPEILRDRLNGGNADEITADAQKLAEHYRPNLRTVPTPLVKGGGAAEYYRHSDEIDPIKLAARILQRRMGPN